MVCGLGGDFRVGEFLIVENGLLHDNGVPRLGVQSTITNQQSLTGPSTNGRSSAFGALCLGSNPSGPAKFSGQLPVPRRQKNRWYGSLQARLELKARSPKNHGNFSHADRQG